MAVGAYFGMAPLTVVAAALAALVAAGWPALLELPESGAARAVVGLAGVGAVVVAWATPGEPALRYVPVVLAMAIILAFVAEFLRPDGRERMVDSLVGTVSGAVVAVSCAGWIAAGRTDQGAALVVTSAVALAVASAVCALPLTGWTNALATFALAVVAGGGVAWAMPELDRLSGVWAGAVAGLLVAAIDALFDQLPTVRGRLVSVCASAVPVAVGGTLIFVVGRVIVG